MSAKPPISQGELIRCLKDLKEDIGIVSNKITKLSDNIHKAEKNNIVLAGRITALEDKQSDMYRRLCLLENDELLIARQDSERLSNSTLQKWNWVFVLGVGLLTILLNYLLRL